MYFPRADLSDVKNCRHLLGFYFLQHYASQTELQSAQLSSVWLCLTCFVGFWWKENWKRELIIHTLEDVPITKMSQTTLDIHKNGVAASYKKCISMQVYFEQSIPSIQIKVLKTKKSMCITKCYNIRPTFSTFIEVTKVCIPSLVVLYNH